MKDIKLTLKACTKHYKAWTKVLWKPYLALAFAAAILLYGIYCLSRETLLPLWLLGKENLSWEVIRAIVGIGVVTIIILLVGLIATGITSVWAHKKMRAVVGYERKLKSGESRLISGYEKRDLTGRRRRVLTMETVLIMIAAALVGFLPVIVLFISGLAAMYSGMMLDEVPTPAWVMWCFVICAFFGTLLCEIAMTFCRLCFRDVPVGPVVSDVSVDPENPVVAEVNSAENNIDNTIA